MKKKAFLKKKTFAFVHCGILTPDCRFYAKTKDFATFLSLFSHCSPFLWDVRKKIKSHSVIAGRSRFKWTSYAVLADRHAIDFEKLKMLLKIITEDNSSLHNSHSSLFFFFLSFSGYCVTLDFYN